MKWLLFVLLMSTPALAQQPEATQAATPDLAHICATHYPRTAVRLHYEGITTLAFQVTSSGAVTNVIVKKSSGHPILDDASVACVQQWQYTPTPTNGATMETSKEVNIAWKVNDGIDPLLFMIESATADCIKKQQPSDEALAKANKNTVAQIQFHESGVPSVELKSPSGSPDLDNMVVGCLGHLPPNVALHVPFGFVIPFSWKADVQAKAPPASATASK